ncbi:MAG TPA: FtsQ-type POTRA domain-containing protein, partial [Alphaproteobacteria bacterium]|nr:FtsQ-type POTRA domain-containing protein [Alphaproteobacteria bacterium]
MTRDGGRRSRPGAARHEAANRERGARARAHLARARERERRRLAQRERERERSRHLRGGPDPRARIRRAVLFAASGGLGLALAGLLGEPLWGAIGPRFAAVETIAVQGHVVLPSAEIAAATGVSPGTALAGVDPSDVQARLSALPWVREARVLRLPPSTLLVRVREREPRAVLSAGDGSRPVRLVDAEGTAFESERIPEGLPLLVGGEALPSGAPHERLATALALLADLDTTGAGALADDHGRLALHLPRGDAPEGWVLRGAAEVVLGRDAGAERFDRLAELLRSGVLATQGGSGPLRIDLRFADQAV